MAKHSHILVAFVIAGLLGLLGTAHSAQIKVLSDGPLEPALSLIADPFRRETGHTVQFGFGLSPVIHKRIVDGELADVVIIQPNFIDELVRAGKLVSGEHPVVSRVGVGLFVRADATAPDISTPAALKRAVLAADALVFSNVAAGNHFAAVLERLEVADAVKDKVVRASPADVIARIVQGRANDIGVGTVSLILRDRRLKLVGPLPEELQSYLVYAAAIMNNAQSPDAGRTFIKFLLSSGARSAFTTTGAD